MATFTSSANTGATEMDVISSIVQDELKRSAKLRPTISDWSSMAVKGVKSIDIPRFSTSFSGPAAQNVDGTTETTAQTLVFAADTISLDQWVTLPYEIPDRVSEQSMLNLEAELAKSAGADMGNFIDDKIITELKLGSASSPDHLVGLGSDTGGVGTAIALADIAKARRLLNRQNVPQDDRYFLIPPEMEETVIGLDNFRNADKYGSREALLQGEVGQIYGFRVIVHNGLAANEAVAYHKTAVGIAVQQEVKFESRRLTLKLQSTEYSFALGMGVEVLDAGKRNVYFLGA